jgi:hypothetical protein
MTITRISSFLAIAIIACTFAKTSSAQFGPRQGVVGGAILGAIIGDQNNEALAGAAIGGLVGGVAGRAIQNNNFNRYQGGYQYVQPQQYYAPARPVYYPQQRIVTPVYGGGFYGGGVRRGCGGW